MLVVLVGAGRLYEANFFIASGVTSVTPPDPPLPPLGGVTHDHRDPPKELQKYFKKIEKNILKNIEKYFKKFSR